MSNDVIRTPGDSSWVTLSAVLLSAVAVRSVVLILGFEDLQADPDSYALLAMNWANTGTFGIEDAAWPSGVRPTAFRPPLYPWLLSWLVLGGQLNLWLVGALQVVLGVGSVGLTFGLARKLSLTAAWLPALAVAFDPILLRGGQLIMTETLATFCSLLTWWLWLLAAEAPPRSTTRWCLWSLVGAAFGLTILARPTAAAWSGLVVLAVLCLRQLSWSVRVQRIAMLGLLQVLIIAPWMVRNERLLGEPIWATTHGGYTLWLANNPSLYAHFQAAGPSRSWDSDGFQQAWIKRRQSGVELSDPATWPPPEVQGAMPGVDGDVVAATGPELLELEDNQLAYEAAWKTIQSQPGLFVLSSLYRASWLWAAWPHFERLSPAVFAIGAWYLSWYLAALIALLRHPRQFLTAGWVPGLALVLALTIVHAVYWGNMRMRGQLMPVVYLAAAALVQPGSRLASKSTLRPRRNSGPDGPG